MHSVVTKSASRRLLRPFGLSEGRAGYARQWLAFLALILLVDAVVVLLALGLAYDVRILSGLLEYYAPAPPDIYQAYILAGVPIWISQMAFGRLYHIDTLLGGVDEYREIAATCLRSALLLVVLSFFLRSEIDLSRGWIVLSMVSTIVGLTGSRFLLRRLGYALRQHGWLTANVLIVGASDQGIAMASQWISNKAAGMNVVGFADDFKPAGTQVLGKVRVLGTPTNIDALARQTDADEVVLLLNAAAWETTQEFLNGAAKSRAYTLRVSPGIYDVLSSVPVVSSRTTVPLFTLGEGSIVGIDALLKTIPEIVFGLLLLVPTLASTGVIALALRRDGRSAFERLNMRGRGGVPFTMWRFALDPAARAGTGGRRLERALARRGLDKLPQLLHVLGGQMSLIGPRPRAAGDPAHTALQLVKPGVIGLYSFRPLGGQQMEDAEDLRYIRNWTIWLDLKILLNAALAVVGLRTIRVFANDPVNPAKNRPEPPMIHPLKDSPPC